MPKFKIKYWVCVRNVICECYQENSLNVWKLFSCISVNLFLMRQLILDIPRLFHQRRQWHPTPVLLPGKSHGRRSLVVYSPWGRWGSDTTERLHFHFSLSCIGEGNGNPLQCSCLENPRDGGAWWAAIYGVAQSQTRLKWLSSSSSRLCHYLLNDANGQEKLVEFRIQFNSF